MPGESEVAADREDYLEVDRRRDIIRKTHFGFYTTVYDRRDSVGTKPVPSASMRIGATPLKVHLVEVVQHNIIFTKAHPFNVLVHGSASLYSAKYSPLEPSMFQGSR